MDKLAGIFLIKNKQVWTWVFCQSEHLAMLQAASDVQIYYPGRKCFTKGKKINGFIALHPMHCPNMSGMKYVCGFSQRRNGNQEPPPSQECKLHPGYLDFMSCHVLSYLDCKLGRRERISLILSAEYILINVFMANKYISRREFAFFKESAENLKGMNPGLLQNMETLSCFSFYFPV